MRLIGINASEKNKDGSYPNTIDEFRQKVRAVGLGELELLKPMGYWGITFWDWCVWADGVGEPMVLLEEQLHKILFPEISFSHQEHCAKLGITPQKDFVEEKWRNAKCDVLTIWSHIFYSNDVFVTNDRNFLKETKKPELIRLGAKKILTPEEAAVHSVSI